MPRTFRGKVLFTIAFITPTPSSSATIRLIQRLAISLHFIPALLRYPAPFPPPHHLFLRLPARRACFLILVTTQGVVCSPNCHNMSTGRATTGPKQSTLRHCNLREGSDFATRRKAATPFPLAKAPRPACTRRERMPRGNLRLFESWIGPYAVEGGIPQHTHRQFGHPGEIEENGPTASGAKYSREISTMRAAPALLAI